MKQLYNVQKLIYLFSFSFKYIYTAIQNPSEHVLFFFRNYPCSGMELNVLVNFPLPLTPPFLFIPFLATRLSAASAAARLSGASFPPGVAFSSQGKSRLCWRRERHLSPAHLASAELAMTARAAISCGGRWRLRRSSGSAK